MAETIRLSICITTFNRAAYISETLDSIVRELPVNAEVIVLDGGSTDATEAIVARYAATHSRLRYVRQATNNGVDQDFDRAVSLASGDYCWLMTDDDLLKPGAIQTVLRELNVEPSLVVVNAEIWNSDFTKILAERRLSIDADRVYGPETLSRLFADTGEYLTFIGCVVIRRSLWLSRERNPYFGSLFIHVGVIFQKPLPGNVVVVAQPLVAIRYGVAMWQPREFEVWMFKWPHLVWSLSGPADESKAALCHPEPWRSLYQLIFYRGRGSYSLREYRRWIAPRSLSLWKRLAALSIALAPGTLVNTMFLFYAWSVYSGSTQRIVVLDTKNSRYYVGRWLSLIKDSKTVTARPGD